MSSYWIIYHSHLTLSYWKFQLCVLFTLDFVVYSRHLSLYCAIARSQRMHNFHMFLLLQTGERLQSNFNIDLRDERRNDRQILRGGKYRIAKMHIAIYNILIRTIWISFYGWCNWYDIPTGCVSIRNFII